MVVGRGSTPRNGPSRSLCGDPGTVDGCCAPKAVRWATARPPTDRLRPTRTEYSGEVEMQRLLTALLPLAALFLLVASSAQATIHPIVASFCAEVSDTNPKVLDPPGQTPPSLDPNTWDTSDLRALLATGVLTLTRDASGNVTGFTVDLTHPSVKGGGFAAFTRCPHLH